jgi:hypothetical protein
VATVGILLLATVLSIALIVGVVMLGRNATLDPRKDQALLAYLAAHNYLTAPPVDARPPSLASLYGATAFGVVDGLSFALTVTTMRGQSITTIFLASRHAQVGTWFGARRGTNASANAGIGVAMRLYVPMTTNDPAYDGQFDTYRTGHDGPSADVRAGLLAFPGGVETAGWTEGRVAVGFVTSRELDPVRLDAAFALGRAIANQRT